MVEFSFSMRLDLGHSQLTTAQWQALFAGMARVLNEQNDMQKKLGVVDAPCKVVIHWEPADGID